MKFITARQVIHDAFISDVKGIDIKALYEEGGIQFTAKGADNKIMDHVGKGFIQQALAIQKVLDPVSWAWNMFAYAPPGTCGSTERHILHEELMRRRGTALGIPPLMMGMLCRMAMHDVAHEEVTGHRRRRKYEHMAKLFQITPEEYKKSWHKHYVAFRGYCQELPEQSLPPISNVLWLFVEKADGDPLAAEDLRRALRMPREAA